MTRAASFLLLLFSFILLPVSPAVGGQALCRSEADDIAALRMFNRAINAYVEMHRRLEVPLSPLRISSDPEATASATDRLAEAIRAERFDAVQGDVFGPEVADLIRARLITVRQGEEGDWAAVPFGLEGEDVPCAPLPVVNARFVGVGSAPIGPALDRLLPCLPLELEYRFSGRALVLVDVGAALVVDVLEEPFP